VTRNRKQVRYHDKGDRLIYISNRWAKGYHKPTEGATRKISIDNSIFNPRPVRWPRGGRGRGRGTEGRSTRNASDKTKYREKHGEYIAPGDTLENGVDVGTM
jgi:hypothetical protein